MHIDLTAVRNEKFHMGRPKFVVALWAVCSLLFVENPWLFRASWIRVAVLRAFGAKIGAKVTIRSRVRVHFPWRLTIGDGCWIGEGAWLHNQDRLTLGNNVTVSQEAFVTTGSHGLRDMVIRTKPVVLEEGCWITSRAIVLAGVKAGAYSVLSAGSVATADMEPGWVYSGNPADRRRKR